MTAKDIAQVVAAAEGARRGSAVDDEYAAALVPQIQDILDRPNDGPANPHRRWVGAQIANDWEYGETYSEANKKDPKLVEYAELPAELRVSAHLMFAITRTLAAHAPAANEPSATA